MAEIKNSFLRSKMNKDLDDRLIPNGEYRDAQNISVGKSEDDDIGSLETVLGNFELTSTDLASAAGGVNGLNPLLPIHAFDMEVIGYLEDENSNKVYVFATNYKDTTGPNYVSQPVFISGSTKRCIIYSFDTKTPATINILIDNIFLNFSTTNPVQASIIEDLLFFTDDRNQPRKINVTNTEGYYTEESQISVAKYNPYTVISLVKKTESIVLAAQTTTSTPLSTQTNVIFIELSTGNANVVLWFSQNPGGTLVATVGGVTIADNGTPSLVTGVANSGSQITFNSNVTVAATDLITFTLPITSTVFNVAPNQGITLGMSVSSISSTGDDKIEGGDFITVAAISATYDRITLSSAPPLAAKNPASGDQFTFLSSTMTDASSVTNWPGDPDYLEDRFVRFSYRFQFDDGEYSIMAPFTQIAYIPKQKGYFFKGDEDAAYRSTILQWMENEVNNIELLITLPEVFSTSTNGQQITVTPKYKIRSIDVLYKESDALVAKVLENLDVSQVIEASTNNIFTYNYQSRKPYKTLTEDQTVRVYDRVPVRALAQETAGSRIIYGNFTDIYTPPGDLDYEVRIVEKDTNLFDNWVEYPNHTLKQNRNYQVGFVLADKYGRQTPVLLSPVKTASTVGYLGSTIYSPYNTSFSNIKQWFGDALQVAVNSSVPGGFSGSAFPNQPDFQTGTPGLYAVRASNDGYNTFNATPASKPSFNITNKTYTFTLKDAGVTPVKSDYLRGEYVDYVEITNVDASNAPVYVVTCDGPVNEEIYSQTLASTATDLKYAYTLNQTGWYSYKVVVKQNEQDYYNVYLPGILNGYPNQSFSAPVDPINDPIPFPSSEDGKTANIVLFNDNINKIPRDLSEVGPDQKQFRSSVELFGRVTNNTVSTNIQYFPGTQTDTAISISTAKDAGAIYAELTPSNGTAITPGGQDNLYQIETDPLLARLSTNVNIIANTAGIGRDSDNMRPFLAIYETEPVESLLDLYWETATEGLISDLNADVDTGSVGATGFTATGYEQFESMSHATYVTNWFAPTTAEGVVLDGLGAYTFIGTDQVALNAIVSIPISAGWTIVAGNEGSNSPNGVAGVNGGAPKFILEQDMQTVSGNRFKYRLKLNIPNNDNAFVYKFGSDANDVYTFTLPLTTSTSGVVSGPVSSSFNGSLTNVTPAFVPATLAAIFKDVDQGSSIASPFIDYAAINGSVNNDKTNGLSFTITSGNDDGFFTLDAPSGKLFQTNGASSTPYGTYTLVIQVCDATQAGTPPSADTNTICNPQTQVITIGPERLNTGVKSLNCLTGGRGSGTVPPLAAAWPQTGSGSGAGGTMQFTAPNESDNVYYNKSGGRAVSGIWYLGDGAARTGYSTGANQNWEGMTIVGAKATENGGSSAPYAPGNPWKLGGALTGGTVAISCNVSIDNADPTGINGFTQFLAGTTQFRVYYKSGLVTTADSPDNTVVPVDTNAQTMVISSAAPTIPIEAGMVINDTNTPGTRYGTVISVNSATSFQVVITVQIPAQAGGINLTFSTIWSLATDANNNRRNYTPNSRGSNLQTYLLNTAKSSWPTGGGVSFAQFIFAFDKAGDYAILLDEASTFTGTEAGQRMVTWVNSNDLNYSDCVIEGGARFPVPTVVDGLAQAIPYAYGSSTNAAGSGDPTCAFSNSNILYSPVPYGEYVLQWFTNTTFTGIWTEMPDGTTLNTGGFNSDNNWFGFKPQCYTNDSNVVVCSPYRETTAVDSEYTISARITTATGKKYLPTSSVSPITIDSCDHLTTGKSSWSQYCNPANSTLSCEPVARKFPYALST